MIQSMTAVANGEVTGRGLGFGLQKFGYLPEDRTDQTAYVGAGLRFYLTRRFFVRADYRWHTVFTSRDDNEELEEWKVLIACFF